MNLKVDPENDLDPQVLRKRDDLYESAIEVVLREGRGSCSLLQRALGIGYGRAARLVDYMAEDGIVGDHNGSSAREVLLTMEEWDDELAREFVTNHLNSPNAPEWQAR